MQFVVLGLGSNVSFNGMSSLEILKSACKDLSNAVSKATFPLFTKLGPCM